MTATALFPLALWAEGTNQNSTPANDNALRVAVLCGPAKGFASAAPAGPVEGDQWVIDTGWGGFVHSNIVVYTGGTWKEFATFEGQLKTIAAVPHWKSSGTDWSSLITGS